MRRYNFGYVICLLIIYRTGYSADIIDLGILNSATVSNAYDVTPDGRFVVGRNGDSPPYPFIWTDNGMNILNDVPHASVARGVSTDGKVVVGFGTDKAFRWTQSEGTQLIGSIPGGEFSYALGVSGDGKIVIGTDAIYHPPGKIGHAFTWNSSNGIQELIGLPGTKYSYASAVTTDGKIAAGTSNSSDGDHVVRWNISTGVVEDIGIQSGFGKSIAHSVSDDGNTIIGTSQYADGTHSKAFYWTASSGFVSFEFLPSVQDSHGYDGSQDGNITVGTSYVNGGSRAFVALNSKVYILTDLLKAVNTGSIGDWSYLTNASAISGDSVIGYNIVGTGMINGEAHAYLIRGLTNVPEPSAVILSLIAITIFVFHIMIRK